MNLVTPEIFFEEQRRRVEVVRQLYDAQLAEICDQLQFAASQTGGGGAQRLPCCRLYVAPTLPNPDYNYLECRDYVLQRLRNQGFEVYLLSPRDHAFWVSWSHYVPRYVRDRLFQQTGIELDEHGVAVSAPAPAAGAPAQPAAPAEPPAGGGALDPRVRDVYDLSAFQRMQQALDRRVVPRTRAP